MMPWAERAIERAPRASTNSTGTGLPQITFRWSKRANALSSTGIVYYLERSDGAVKVGCTRNYPRRRSALVRQHGFLALIAWEIGYDDVESLRHEQFAHLRIDPLAEWFQVQTDLYSHIMALRAAL